MEDFHHISVLPDEVLAALAPRSGGIYLDGTLGHLSELVKGQVGFHEATARRSQFIANGSGVQQRNEISVQGIENEHEYLNDQQQHKR